MPSGWNDRVSSVAVYRTYGGSNAIGKWKSVTGTGTVNFTYHVGFSSTKSTEEQTNQEYSLKYEMSTGFDFEVESLSETISESYTYDIMDDAKFSMTKDLSIDWPIPCDGASSSTEGVGLWQWVVQTADKNSWVLTTHTVCRYGSLFNVPPKCPWNACSNGDCS